MEACPTEQRRLSFGIANMIVGRDRSPTHTIASPNTAERIPASNSIGIAARGMCRSARQGHADYCAQDEEAEKRSENDLFYRLFLLYELTNVLMYLQDILFY